MEYVVEPHCDFHIRLMHIGHTAVLREDKQRRCRRRTVSAREMPVETAETDHLAYTEFLNAGYQIEKGAAQIPAQKQRHIR